VQLTQHLEPEAGDETRYEVFSRLALPPGRHQVRFNATSRAADDSGSVMVDVEVPDLSRPTPTASAIVLGTPPGATRTDPLAPLLPIVPTTARDFTAADRVTALLELFSGDVPLSEPVQIEAKIVGADDRVAKEDPASTIPAEAFAESRSARYMIDLPLAGLKSGLHLLSITATFDRSRIVRRDVVFRVR
jgi:hypothetical protein